MSRRRAVAVSREPDGTMGCILSRPAKGSSRFLGFPQIRLIQSERPVIAVLENVSMADSYTDRLPQGLPPAADPAREYEPIQPGSGRRGPRERIGAAFAALLVVLSKAKAILFVLPKLKLLTSFGSMVVSIAAYTLVFGFPFAIGFVGLLFLHEMGHVIALRREGIKASAPMFIPFLGAVISAKSLGDDAAAEARVGLAGPILGSAAALIPLAIWLQTGDDFWRALAYVGFLLNLFNLLPVLPLDGGRAMAALSPLVWGIGFAGLIALAVFYPSPIVFLILIFGGLETWRRWKARSTPEGQAYYAVPARTRILVGVVYLGLASALAVGVAETFAHRSL